MKINTKICSSLEKILPSQEPALTIPAGSALRGETYAFQVAYQTEYATPFQLRVKLKSELNECTSIRNVVLVPAEYVSSTFDDDYVARYSGFYPDVLRDFGDDALPLVRNQWRALWVNVKVPETCTPGKYRIEVILEVENPKTNASITESEIFTLEVIDALLPPQKLIQTNWFHSDCLSTYYQVPVFSEKHWEIIGNFMRCAAEHGNNMILTPIVTPPLDTEVGGQRPTVQLVDVICNAGVYQFNFDKLERWINLAHECKIKYFEMAHLFTQWGAEFTPKIIATVDGVEKQIFGWDVRANSEEYQHFLSQFLPALANYLKAKKIDNNVYFHCSDEPSIDHLENYAFASGLLRKYLDGFKFIDALSNVDFYKHGLVNIPVPIETHYETFSKLDLPERWIYFCCYPTTIYPNRLIAMSSSRNRIMGTLMYYYGIEGFLHWGYNFYYSTFSRYAIDPYTNTDSGLAFPAGDGFVVYPGKNGKPESSLRFEVWHEGLQDMRALQLLETKMDRGKIIELLDNYSPYGKITMENYPRGAEQVLKLREKINNLIKQVI